MFRFSIRDVLWLTVVVAMGVGWWVDRSWLWAAKSAAENDARDLGRFSDPFATPVSEERVRQLQRKYFPAEGKLRR